MVSTRLKDSRAASLKDMVAILQDGSNEDHRLNAASKLTANTDWQPCLHNSEAGVKHIN
jgi:hypothetical protein